MITELQAGTWGRLLELRGRVPHALLLHGAEGVGKLALAERFAQALLCEHVSPPGEPCGRCDACRWFAAANHPDVRYVEPEAIAHPRGGTEESGQRQGKPSRPSREIKVDQIRALADFVHLGSHRGGVRIAILHPAEQMNPAAANALLKSLEEPPAGAIFLLVSHRPGRLPATVRSRCVAIPVPLPDAAAAHAWLERQGIESARRWLAFAGGAPRKALDWATSEQSRAVEELIRGFEAGDPRTILRVQECDIELLADAAQKFALDRAFSGLAGRVKYFPLRAAAAGGAPAGTWLACARQLGVLRQLARYPLNPKLFAEELLSCLPSE